MQPYAAVPRPPFAKVLAIAERRSRFDHAAVAIVVVCGTLRRADGVLVGVTRQPLDHPPAEVEIEIADVTADGELAIALTTARGDGERRIGQRQPGVGGRQGVECGMGEHVARVCPVARECQED